MNYLIVPSVRALLGMWTKKFHFTPLSAEECSVIEERVVAPDEGTAPLLKKRIYM